MQNFLLQHSNNDSPCFIEYTGNSICYTGIHNISGRNHHNIIYGIHYRHSRIPTYQKGTGAVRIVSITDIRIERLGSIAYRVISKCPEKALIAEAPYIVPHQYIVAIFWLMIIIISIPFIPFIPRIVFAILSILPLMLLLSMFCTLRVFKNHWICVRRLRRDLAVTMISTRYLNVSLKKSI